MGRGQNSNTFLHSSNQSGDHGTNSIMTGAKAKSVATLVALAFAAMGLGSCTAPMVSTDNSLANLESEPLVPDIPDVPLTSGLLSKLMVAEMSYFRNDPHTSIEIFEEVAFETRDPRIASRASLMAIDSRRLDVAANTTDLWVELSPENYEAWFSRGAVKVMTGYQEDAVTDFSKALELTNNEVLLTQRIAGTISSSLPPETGFDLFNDLMARFPNSQSGHLMLVNFAIAASKSNEETDALLDAAENIVEDSDALANTKFTVYRYTDRDKEAESFAKQYLRNNPDSVQLRQTYAEYLSDSGYYREAVRQFELIDNANALLELGDLHSRANYLNLAYEKYLDYRDRRPEDQIVLLGLAEISLSQKRFEDAKEWIVQIRSPRYLFHRVTLSAQYIANTETVEQAISLLTQFKARNEQERIRVILSISEIYQDADRLNDAKMTLDNALGTFPDHSSLLLARSYVAAELNLLELVESDTKAVLVQHPDHPHALNALGYVLADQTDRLDEALDLIEKALSFRPNDPYILDSMGWVQFRLGNLDSAIEFLEIAMDKRDDPVIAAHLGEVYWVVGEEQKAKTIWDRALKKSPEDKILIETVERFIN